MVNKGIAFSRLDGTIDLSSATFDLTVPPSMVNILAKIPYFFPILKKGEAYFFPVFRGIFTEKFFV